MKLHVYSFLFREGVPDMVKKEYINENGEGHWRLSNGKTVVTCDLNELHEVMLELEIDREQEQNISNRGIALV